MERKEIEEKVKAFLIDELEVEEEKIAPEALLKEDIGIDSLDFVDIVVIVERTFGFKIKPEEMAGVKTLNDFCDYIETKVGNRRPEPRRLRSDGCRSENRDDARSGA